MTSSRDRSLRLIREALESLVTPIVAGQALFEALELWGDEPIHSDEDVVAFIDEQLREALDSRVGSETANDAIDHIRAVLDRLVQPPERAPAASASVAADSTTRIPRQQIPPRVIVVSAHDQLTQRLRTALGAARLTLGTASDVEDVRRLVEDVEPSVVLINGTDLPGGDYDALVAALEDGPDYMVRVMWGIEGANALRFLNATRRRGVEVMPLDRREGVDPLLDLLRSRAAQH